MNIFVTVGTTPFDDLIRRVDHLMNRSELTVRFQIFDGAYKPRSGSYFRFTNNIQEMYDWADLVITHAGAGSIYTLLEQRKRLIIVPNIARRDPHQSEIARYIEHMSYAQVVWDLKDIADAIELSPKMTLKTYDAYPFFMGKELSQILIESIKQ